MKWIFLILIISCSTAKKEEVKSSELKSYLEDNKVYEEVLSSEGQYVMAFNPRMVPFIKSKITKSELKKIQEILKPALEISLTENNFTKAAERLLKPEQKDDTNYDAVWIRDNAWIYFALDKQGHREKAKKLILALWDYYASAKQWERFIGIIKDPSLAKESKMNVPHIRFDGSSSKYEDVLVEGKPQLWNHRQNDAHGLFLLALSDAVDKKIIMVEDFTDERKRILSLFPNYFDKINYASFKGAGAWEEIDKVNTSSIAMVVKSMESWRKVLRGDKKIRRVLSWSSSQMSKLIRDGYKTINRQLFLGGESTEQSPYELSYRKEDAALFNLFLPWPLDKISRDQKRYAIAILEKLERPFGIIRYKNDSYQGGNYWIAPKKENTPELTGDASSDNLFLSRFKALTPHSEAQWFFDSKLSMIHSQSYIQTIDPVLKEQSKYLAIYHFKRAIGQITGKFTADKVLAADAKEVRDLQVPESINTIVIDGKKYFLPSPITPLNWAKASLGMAIVDLEKILD